MMTLTTKIVQPFIATLEEALHYKVTITDTNGHSPYRNQILLLLRLVLES